MESNQKQQLIKKVLSNCEYDVNANIDDRKLTREANLYAQRVLKRYTGRFAINVECIREPVPIHTLDTLKDNNPLSHIKLTSPFIRSILKEFYINRREIPTIKDIESYAKDPEEVEKHPDGFIWMQMPGMKQGIIVENPERVAKRILYLKKLEEYREAGAHIIYVDMREFINIPHCSLKISQSQGIIKQPRYLDMVFLVASAKMGLIRNFFYYECDNYTVDRWLNDVVSSLDKYCVLVFQETNVEPPTEGSSKLVMSDWLSFNRIPHNPESHRGELYSLIKKFSSCSANFFLDEAMNGLGYNVLKRPCDMEELDFFYAFWQFFTTQEQCEGNNLKKLISDYVTTITIDDWQQTEKKLIETEKQKLIDDMLMEQTIDNLVTMAKDGALPKNTIGLLQCKNNWNKVYKELIIPKE
jgi:hypothetical protein